VPAVIVAVIKGRVFCHHSYESEQASLVHGMLLVQQCDVCGKQAADSSSSLLQCRQQFGKVSMSTSVCVGVVTACHTCKACCHACYYVLFELLGSRWVLCWFVPFLVVPVSTVGGISKVQFEFQKHT
jgi:hypothetical protein